MFRRATGLLARPIMSSARARTRPFSTDLSATEDDDSDCTDLGDYLEQMLKDDAPKTPLSFMQPRPPTPPSIPTKLTDNFDLPKASVFVSKEVDMIIIPATTGQMGVLPGHVGAFVELKPGVMSVHEGNDTTKYFVSGGFAFISANSLADVMAVEAVPLDHIDQSLVQKGLAEFTQKLSSASTKLEKAEAQIGVDVHTALNAALTGCSFL